MWREQMQLNDWKLNYKAAAWQHPLAIGRQA
jgi:hypothetical protein